MTLWSVKAKELRTFAYYLKRQSHILTLKSPLTPLASLAPLTLVSPSQKFAKSQSTLVSPSPCLSNWINISGLHFHFNGFYFDCCHLRLSFIIID
jgi:hypothetical protein